MKRCSMTYRSAIGQARSSAALEALLQRRLDDGEEGLREKLD